MPLIDPATLAEPISDSAPCGPDLDLEGDADFERFMADVDGRLPANFFERNPNTQEITGPFDRARIDFDKEQRSIADFLARSRDLRLLVVQAKLAILNRDLGGFASTLAAMARLLAERWADVHPQGEGEDYTLRLATLQTLEDGAAVVMPLQHIPLVQSRRFGPIHMRHILLRRGDARPFPFEEVPDESALTTALSKETDFGALKETWSQVVAVRSAIREIEAAWRLNAGGSEAVSFPKLAAVVDQILQVLDPAIAARDPSAPQPAPAGSQAAGAQAAEGAAPAGAAHQPVTAIRSAAEASAALAEAAAYFAEHEPSSLALPLLRQAQQLVGRPFYEIIQILVPNYADQAAVRMGVDFLFEVPVGRLGNGAGQGSGDDARDDGAQSDSAPSDEPSAAPFAHAAASARSSSAGSSGEPGESTRIVRTRPEAVALLEQVSAFYRVHEPASPIPLLADRACGVAQKDFMSLLKDVLPALNANQE